jgi:hypothetical protein
MGVPFRGIMAGMVVVCGQARASVGNGCRAAMEGLSMSRKQTTAAHSIKTCDFNAVNPSYVPSGQVCNVLEKLLPEGRN